jgi:hypothetical protein
MTGAEPMRRRRNAPVAGGTLPADPLAAIMLLRAVRDHLAANAPPDLALPFAAMLADYEAGEHFEKAFGLTPANGQKSWRTLDRRARRDAGIVEMWRRFYHHLGATGAAVGIAKELRRHVDAGAGRIEKDERRILCGEIKKLGGDIGERQVWNVLRAAAGRVADVLKGGAGHEITSLPSLHGCSFHKKAPTLPVTAKERSDD